MALAFSTAALAAAALLSMAGNDSDYRPWSPARQYHEQLIGDFKILQAVEPALHEIVPETSSHTSPPGAAPETTAEPATSPDCSGQSWPYFSSDCLWSAATRQRSHIVVRRKSPWCAGVLQHQPFRSCRPRPE